MIIKVTYNKNTNELNILGDIDIISLNSNSVEDTADNLNFEIAVDTTSYEEINSLSELDLE